MSHKIIVPSILELRYGGRRLVEALDLIASGGDQEKIRNLLNDTLFDCYRARHDAIDTATSKMVLITEAYRESIGYNAILKASGNFPSFVSRLQEVRDNIAVSRENRENRDAIYTSISEVDFPDLLTDYAEMTNAEPIMRSLARSERFYNILGIAGFIFGLISFGALIIIYFSDIIIFLSGFFSGGGKS